MEKYRRAEKPRQNEEPIKENELRVTTQGKMRSSISYATGLFTVRLYISIVCAAPLRLSDPPRFFK
jgi:hypothetical protein